MKSSIIGFFISIIFSINGKVIIVPDQILENCSPDNEGDTVVDFSDLHLIPENDTHTFLNGKWKFLTNLKAPWHGSLTTEKYIRGKWLMQMFKREYEDICAALHSPAEPVYNIFKHVPGCPMNKGTSWEFDMVPITFSQTLLNTMPSHYAGRWRAIFVGKFVLDDGKIVEDCRRAYADIYEV